MLPIRKMQSWLPTIINDYLENEWPAKLNNAAPDMNIMECEERFRVEISTPGMTKDDFSVEVKNENQLVVTMEKKSEGITDKSKSAKDKSKEKSKEEPKVDPKVEGECNCEPECDCAPKCCCSEEHEKRNGKYLRREFTYSHFRQTLVLPENVDRTKITAKQENGILTIFIPKKESVIEAQATKKITVE